MKANRSYVVRFTVAMVSYALLLVGALLLVQVVGAGPARYLVMLLPLPALVLVVRSVYLLVREADELQSRILLESLAIGFAGGSLITFSWGLMQTVGAPQVPWLLVFPVYAACWLIGSVVARWRYR